MFLWPRRAWPRQACFSDPDVTTCADSDVAVAVADQCQCLRTNTGRRHEIAGEMIAYRESSAEAFVQQLLVCDGETSRHNRTVLLSDEFKVGRGVGGGGVDEGTRGQILIQYSEREVHAPVSHPCHHSSQVCGLSLKDHPSLSNVLVMPVAGGFAPPPLNEKITISCSADATPSETFQRVLDSIPVQQVHEQVATALESGMEVTLEYEPGKVKAIFAAPDGKKNAIACDWS